MLITLYSLSLRRMRGWEPTYRLQPPGIGRGPHEFRVLSICPTAQRVRDPGELHFSASLTVSMMAPLATCCGVARRSRHPIDAAVFSFSESFSQPLARVWRPWM